MKTRIVLATLTAAVLGMPLLAHAGATFVETDREAGALLVVERDAGAAPIAAPAGAPTSTTQKGGLFVENRGNAGWRYVGHIYARRDGQWVCVDGIDHGARATSTPADKSLYSGG